VPSTERKREKDAQNLFLIRGGGAGKRDKKGPLIFQGGGGGGKKKAQLFAKRRGKIVKRAGKKTRSKGEGKKGPPSENRVFEGGGGIP